MQACDLLDLTLIESMHVSMVLVHTIHGPARKTHLIENVGNPARAIKSCTLVGILASSYAMLLPLLTLARRLNLWLVHDKAFFAIDYHLGSDLVEHTARSKQTWCKFCSRPCSIYTTSESLSARGLIPVLIDLD